MQLNTVSGRKNNINLRCVLKVSVVQVPTMFMNAHVIKIVSVPVLYVGELCE